jgi:bifunctional enzyme CysN/CysC|tara:strand:+ start:44 stop:622 length:579 start_codon:yes stop_codon:yes gene_type:complete
VSNLTQVSSKVSLAERNERNGHLGKVIWLTGLSGAGKSTIAMDLERRLFDDGRQVYVLDGDIVRTGLCQDLGFSPKDRAENIRRIGEVALIMANSGLCVIVAFISPFRVDRDRVRDAMLEGCFTEVYVNAPLEVCEQRDTKGLYARAVRGEIADFTGISSPYEPPLSPEVELHTDRLSVAEAVDRILSFLSQ